MAAELPSRPLRVALIAPCRFAVAEPFVGGLEAHVWLLARTLRARGHHVSLFAARGSDPAVAQRHYPFPAVRAAAAGRRDISGDPGLVTDEHAAYLSVMTELADGADERFDVVHNNSLHYLPVALAHRLRTPMVSTLHTPPIRMVELAMHATRTAPARFVAVSRHTADSWPVAASVSVVHNGIDTGRWRPGPGGGPLVWFGRIVPEKGPELAIAAARRAGRRLDLAGPIIDQAYFHRVIAPCLNERVRYLGHLPQTQLAAVVGRASAALVTPRWDEPFGLVVAEALACGTPVAAFARGAIPEILSSECGRLAPADNVGALAAAIGRTVGLSRPRVRAYAERHCSVGSMVRSYEAIYRELVDRPVDHPIVLRRTVRSRAHADSVPA